MGNNLSALHRGVSMPKAQHAFLDFLPRQYQLALFCTCALWLGLGSLDLALARAPYDREDG
ncbi:MAG: hypothetical protein USCAAHI_01847 [Beijerinckiaceae bacterium]|nr:MAG: hypothetical protein USCAAHI_01847 [Beijerinckiaceae bacterium]